MNVKNILSLRGLLRGHASGSELEHVESDSGFDVAYYVQRGRLPDDSPYSTFPSLEAPETSSFKFARRNLNKVVSSTTASGSCAPPNTAVIPR